jgi:Glycosyltransferase
VDALKRYRAIIAVSEFTKRELINLYNVPSERVVVIPNHLPGEYLPQPKCGIHLRMRYSLPEKYWLYVGGYDFRKNVDFLLRSYSMALKDKDLPKLVLAGKIPPDDAYCCTPVMSIVAELGLNEHVIFSGFVQTEDLPFVYSNASLLIYPSQMEGFGLPPLEAMGCGCTAICTNGSSLNEVITDSSHRFEIDNFKPLSMMMLSAASGDLPFNPSFDRNNFSEERTIKKYTSLINTLAG